MKKKTRTSSKDTATTSTLTVPANSLKGLLLNQVMRIAFLAFQMGRRTRKTASVGVDDLTRLMLLDATINIFWTATQKYPTTWPQGPLAANEDFMAPGAAV